MIRASSTDCRDGVPPISSSILKDISVFVLRDLLKVLAFFTAFVERIFSWLYFMLFVQKASSR
jgi:hypothetical protein